MKDPHVERLHYDVGAGPGISFENPPPLTFSNHLGRFDLREGKLVVEPSEHYQNADRARAVIDPFLRSWEIDADLSSNLGAIRFSFSHEDVVDRDPPPSGSGYVLKAESGEFIIIGESATMHLTQHSYPPPPLAFRTTSDVQLAYERWRGFRGGREPLPAMAYAVLTLIEAIAGGRKQAAATFQIALKVLNTMGELSSTRGDASNVRKVKPGKPLRSFSGPESGWLDQAVRALIRRLGEHASGAPLRQITMRDLPPL